MIGLVCEKHNPIWVAPVVVAPHKYRSRCHPVPLPTIFKVCAKNFVVHLEGFFGVFYKFLTHFGKLRAFYEEVDRRTVVATAKTPPKNAEIFNFFGSYLPMLD